MGFASFNLGSASSITGLSGESGAVWIPDGTWNATFSMSPGMPSIVPITLGPTTSGLTAQSGYGRVATHLTRVSLMARTTTGGLFIPRAGTWSIDATTFTSPPTGAPTSRTYWLPDGSYTGNLTGAAKNGSSPFTIGTPTINGIKTVVVGP